MTIAVSRHRPRPTAARLSAAVTALAPAWLWTLTLGTLAAAAWRGWFVRYMADDYGFAGMVRAEGPGALVRWWYVHWSGRFLFAPLVAGLSWLGQWPVPYLLAVLLAVWAALAVWTAHAWGQPALRLPALVIVAAYIVSVPAPGQVLDWQTGMLIYTLPLVLVTALAGLVGASRRHRAAVVAAGIVAALVPGCSETAGVPLAVAALALLALAVWRRDWTRPALVAVTLGALVGLAVFLAAPGNHARQLLFPPPPPLPVTALRAGPIVALVLVHLLASPLALAGPLVALVVAWTVSRAQVPAPPRRLLPALTLAALALIAASLGPAVYAFAVMPEDRTLTVPALVLLLWCAAWGWWLGARWPASPAWALGAVLLAALVLVPAITGTVAATPALAAQAAAWDARDAQIRAAAPAAVVVPVLPASPGLLDFGPDPANWVNAQAAEYYGVASITAR